MPQIIDGRKISENLQKRLMASSQNLLAETGVSPGLAIIRVGNDEASKVYVKRKRLMAEKLGYLFEEHHLSENISEEDLEKEVQSLNDNTNIHGIVIQLPLPKQLDKYRLISLVNPLKDVDGLHPLNSGKLLEGLESEYIPCAPLSCLTMIKTIHKDLKGLNVGIIGCSLLVGRPVAMLMLNQGCTVWMADKNTKNLPEICQKADILIVATGHAGLVKGEWVKEGATVIDVGVNRLSSGKLVGDVDFLSVSQKAGALTPVPGGVGPVTVACLMQNTLQAAYKAAGKDLIL